MGLFLMNLRVKKRDGTVVPFNEEKIKTAIEKAYKEVCKSSFGECQKRQIKEVTTAVCENIQRSVIYPTIDIETIQDTVEYELMSFNKAVAKAYIIYRYKQASGRGDTVD